ncbi:BMP family protein [Glutamicibacter creatinolyticus]|uniref:Nucleoside-binding protein n=1 Tax=Glutamicibacter creatinolyticus TaxID=162496 RepID=A0A5B7WSW7_9MICC|nr:MULTISPECIES: BMP family ABC transporter substrate-binding protein [Micrococcaceae]QCY46334.1 Nucleoside-binding protein [Glutamicibacter creatinolyticus]TLK56801.1 BMP family ABC transporter substrate-binding protein [Glutamicibacter sp. V16R2B1]
MRFASRKASVAAAMLGISALALSACGQAPEEGGANADNSDYTGCIVSDSGGFDDQSFNESSYRGLKKAEEDLGIQAKEAESKSNADFATNLQGMMNAGCNMTVTIGFLLGDATEKAAAENPDKHFAIVDFQYENEIENVKPIIYDTAQAAFLAGYVAAATSKTGTVATYGGIKLPTVTIFMDGFADGVEKFNKDKGENVKLLGWNKDKQDGTFTGDFEKQDKGKQVTKTFISQGADVIMPVAGPVGKGSGAAVKEENAAGKDVKLVWVDSDGFETAPDYKDVMLTSVIKTMDQAVEDVIKEDTEGNFDATPYVGTLENGGVDIAPFHNFEDEVSDETKSEVEALKQQIISGELKVESQASPK